MKEVYKVGDKKKHEYSVKPEDKAEFDGGVVHHVCSTFTLGREMEWSSRLFVLDMKEEDEEGIGTMLEIQHRSPALIGSKLDIFAEVDRISGNEIICNIEVKVGERLVAVGKTGQKIVKKEKLDKIFESLR